MGFHVILSYRDVREEIFLTQDHGEVSKPERQKLLNRRARHKWTKAETVGARGLSQIDGTRN